MATSIPRGKTPAHPAPERYRASWFRQLVGLGGAPAAWVALIIIGNIISSYACYPHRFPLPAPLWESMNYWLTALFVLCLVIGVVSGLVAYMSWRRTRHEKKGGKAQAIDVGEGRTRFLALLGLMSSILFTVAIIFTASAVFLVSPCAPWL